MPPKVLKTIHKKPSCKKPAAATPLELLPRVFSPGSDVQPVSESDVRPSSELDLPPGTPPHAEPGPEPDPTHDQSQNRRWETRSWVVVHANGDIEEFAA